MMQRWIYFFGQGQANGSSDIKHLIGGKGASLADMTRAGLNVPPGFTISAECCDHYHRHGRQWPEGLEAEVRAHLARLEQISGRTFGVGPQPLLVAVRSGAAQSMPGMMDTVLNVGADGEPWSTLRAAIDAVFQSWHSDRAVAYREHHKIDGLLGTAVTVQLMCPAEVAGVLFTANPVNQAAEIIVESAHGLGEAIVLGKVTPDRFVLDGQSLAIKERVLSQMADGAGPSLNDDQLRELAALGLDVASYFGVPCDIEWALSAGRFYLLQSRPIRFKTAVAGISSAEREQMRAAEIAVIKAKAEPGGTVWSRFNLSEILPEPTPMTWAIVKQFMSGKGGFGQMYRDLGFDPDPALDDIGIFDLICGRPYCNLSREPRMQYRNMPLAHDFAQLKKNPSKAIYPQATLNLRGKSLGQFFGFFVRVPFLTLKMWRTQVTQRQALRTFAEQFEKEILPPYLAAVEAARAEDWSKLSNQDLWAKAQHWIKRTLFDFARHSLKPTALAALLLGNLERAFAQRLQPHDKRPAEALALGMQKAQAALRELMIGVHPDEHTDLPAAIRALREGRLTRDEFLVRFGHRGSQEMELARPRWAEEPSSIDGLLAGSASNGPGHPSLALPANVNAWQIAWLKLAEEARLLPSQRPAVETELRRLQTYMALRESAKHHLLRGYALIRRALVELDRRLELAGGIFYLTPTDVANLLAGLEPSEALRKIEANRRQRDVMLSLPLPTVIFSDDLDAVGRELQLSGAASMQGVPLSAGVAEATAWVLHEVNGAQAPHEPYILVCPSTDPAWVPLFAQSRGLVMETGGMLSHGAIVAREFGLPAVAGIADVHRRIHTGPRLRIDGSTGVVNLVG